MENEIHMVDSMEEAKGWLAGLEIGEGIHCRNLTVFPLFHPADGDGGDAKSPRYQLLSEGIDKGEAVVEEVDEGGEVPFLSVKNQGATPILIPEGEILVGAKQNRVVNLTVLVAAAAAYKLAVSCVEQGRWRYLSRHFEAKAWAHPKLRALKVKSVHRNRAAMGGARSDQGEVWEEVGHHLDALAAPSPTSSMTDGFEAAEGRLDGYRKKIRLPEKACGFVAARGGRILGVDLFDDPATMHKLWKRIADAYFVEAVREDEEQEPASPEAAKEFLGQVTERLVPAAEQPELGCELEVSGDHLAGSALWHDGAVCHLAAFSA
ncbi:MAG: hypothetical protein EP299_03590 [Acidobacteria bacterium]|nr:MAG: hypothetical protein EP299_03590 [Acidobacteriota bacterium]